MLTQRPKPILMPLLFEWMMYVVATFNILLVLFDVSYFPLREFYLTNSYVDLRRVVEFYDPYKGVEPNYYNQNYIDTADVLIKRYQANPKDRALPQFLMNLQAQSQYLIDFDPYARVDKTGTLERLKDKIRKHMHNPNATAAFQEFWSPAYLSAQSITYYKKTLKPLISANYFRHYGEDGEFVDRFWQIDIYFVGIFALELVIRTFLIARRLNINFRQALGSRWYDLLWLTFSVHWDWLRLLRLIPYAVRSDHLNTPIHPLFDYINHNIVTYVADQVTDIVVVSLIDEAQDSIREMRFNASLGVNRVSQQWELLIRRQTSGLVGQVLPDIEPEIVQLLHHIVMSTLKKNPNYRTLMPLLGSVPELALEQLIRRSYQSFTHSLQEATRADQTNQVATDHLTSQLTQKLTTDLLNQNIAEDLKNLLIAALEEVKQNYINRNQTQSKI